MLLEFSPLLYLQPAAEQKLITALTHRRHMWSLSPKAGRVLIPFILNDYISDYKTRLIKLNLLPLMYTYDLCDILFFIKSIQHPSDHFDIHSYVSFCHRATRSSSCNKLERVYTSTNKQRNFYLNRLPRTFNSLPSIISSSFVMIRSKTFVDEFCTILV